MQFCVGCKLKTPSVEMLGVLKANFMSLVVVSLVVIRLVELLYP